MDNIYWALSGRDRILIMKTLEEKKLLVKMARAFGQPVDQELLESIEREEQFNKILFKEETQPIVEEPVIQVEKIEEKPQMIIEADPFPTLPSPKKFISVPTIDPIKQTINVLKAANTPNNIYRDKEMEGMRRSINEIMQRISTLSWGGGGTGAVRIIDQDDLVKSTVQNGRYMKYHDGWFVMDEINPYEVVHNTTLVTTNTYVVNDTDYYIGVNYVGPVTIIIPSEPNSGREIVIKDESGNCSNNPITVSGPVDNDNSGFILEVDNGAVHMLFRGDYWRII